MADDKDEEFVTTLGGVKIDWPRMLGYYGALGIAVAFDVIAPPLGLFIAAVPLLKLLKRQEASVPERFVGAIVEGAGKPVGGDADGVVRLKWVDDEKANERDASASASGNAATRAQDDAHAPSH